ncbi:hypothetical protein F3Y22_tig00110830pilonHSYRG00057 [Hibiscus syriacus]|uniref:Uncharacterized protein n=1 Tax=Hibiscus syriacus TaxID=106335 RepID=A0A6A2ZM48_HIBSY|nr:hypothetical protein F3Y22_tig00110830pilonHSYRG00057 [Hibiscus syriacus]
MATESGNIRSILFSWALFLAAAAVASQALPGSQDKCGDVSIPFPFAQDCYDADGKLVIRINSILWADIFTISNDKNKLTLVGCDTEAIITAEREGIGSGYFTGYGSKFTFSFKSFDELANIESLPQMLDWAIGNETCTVAKTKSSYICKCKDGYYRKPYLHNGCQGTYLSIMLIGSICPLMSNVRNRDDNMSG